MLVNFFRRSKVHKQLLNKKQKLPNTRKQETTKRWNRQPCLKRRPREIQEICQLLLASAWGITLNS